MADLAGARDDASYPKPATAWTMVVLLTIAYVLSYVDRSILGALVQPVKADLGLTDEQLGYLGGIAFGLFYVTVGVPLGWLADRRSRTKIVAAGVAVWSLATAASGLARGFWHLFMARMAVGVGEAVLSPCAMSLISDSFPPEKRGKPVGVYSTALALGTGLSGLIGALVLSAGGNGVTLPLVGELKAWQFAFIAVGLPGVLLAAAFMLVPEPPRRGTGSAPHGFFEAFRHVGAHIGSLGGVALLASVMTTIAYSHFFLVAAFARKFGWPAQQFLAVNGTINLVLGPIVVFGFGMLIDTLRKRGVRDAAFKVLIWAFVPMVPLEVIFIYAPTPELALFLNACGGICIGAITSAGILALLDITPPSMRAQIVAFYYMAISVAGLGLGPTTVGVLSTRVFGEDALHHAIAAVPAIYGTVPLLLLPLVIRAYRKRLSEMSA
jgi:MFS family permease